MLKLNWLNRLRRLKRFSYAKSFDKSARITRKTHNNEHIVYGIRRQSIVCCAKFYVKRKKKKQNIIKSNGRNKNFIQTFIRQWKYCAGLVHTNKQHKLLLGAKQSTHQRRNTKAVHTRNTISRARAHIDLHCCCYCFSFVVRKKNYKSTLNFYCILVDGVFFCFLTLDGRFNWWTNMRRIRKKKNENEKISPATRKPHTSISPHPKYNHHV